VTPRPYMSIEQLAAVTPWTSEAIRRMVSRGRLQKGVHYFQLRARGQLVFKWEAIVALIEREAVPAAPAAAAEGDPCDIEAITATLRRVLDRAESGERAPAPALATRRS